MIIRTLIAVMASCVPLWAQAIDIETRETPAGHEVWTLTDTAVPLVALNIYFEGGTQLDLPGKRGATNLMVATLEEGAGLRDARAFAEAREAIAAQFGFRPFDDGISVTAQFTSDVTADAMALLTDALTTPRFDDQAVERVRAQVIAGLRSAAQNPEDKASKAFWATTFPDDPYGSDQSGTEESVAALTPDDLRQAHRRALSKGETFIAVVGDFDWAEIGPLIDTVLAPLPEAPAPAPDPVDPVLNGGVTVLDHDSPQTIIRFGQPGIARDDPDFLTAIVLDQIIGGSFEGRLMQVLREEHGLTYGVWSQLVPNRRGAIYLGGTSVPNARAGEAVTLIREIWQDLAETGVTQAELDRAKTYLTGAYPLRFDGNGPIASILTGMQAQDLGPDYPDGRNALVEAITLADINRVAQTRLAPDRLSFILVGQPEGVAATPAETKE